MRSLFVMLAGVLLWAGSASASPMVSPEWLSERLDDPLVRIIDIRSGISRDNHKSYLRGHVPGAVYANYQKAGWRVERDGVIGMMPPEETLVTLLNRLGVSNDHHVVIYESGKNATDFGSAARVYWTLQTLGHEAVSILKGGYKGWTDAGLAVAQGEETAATASFTVSMDLSHTVTGDELQQIVDDGSAILVDARPYDQFVGKTKHNAAQSAGHIPNALNLDQKANFDRTTGQLKDLDTLAEMFPEAEGDKELISYCNTGHWAATNWFVMSELLGRDKVRMYDESMVGWTQRQDAAVESGNDS